MINAIIKTEFNDTEYPLGVILLDPVNNTVSIKFVEAITREQIEMLERVLPKVLERVKALCPRVS